MATVTVKPKNLGITRSNNLKFTFSWKIGDKNYNAGLELRYRTYKTDSKARSWTTVTLSTSATSKTVTLTKADYHPGTKDNNIAAIEFQVRGKRQNETNATYDWSKWEDAQFVQKLSAPSAPTLTEELTASNQTTFTWNVNTTGNKTEWQPFVRTLWESIKDTGNVSDGSKLSWKSGTSGWQTGTDDESATKVITDDAPAANASVTRWFRVRAQGAAGDSKWVYAKHTYARTKKAKILSATATVKQAVTTVDVEWKADANEAHPIDKVIVYYAFATPASGMSVPTGASWTVGYDDTMDTTGKDRIRFQINNAVSADQCLFVRLCTLHDSQETYSDAVIAYKGKLSAPTITDATIDSVQHKVALTVTNNSAVPDSKIAVFMEETGVSTAVRPSNILGVMAHGTSTITVDYPADAASPKFGVYAFQGSSSYETVDSVKYYKITKNMWSADTMAASAASAKPTDVTIEQSETLGEVIVSWTWSWGAATQAEVSWSQNPNAWESTDTPDTFTVDRISNKVRVSNLEIGPTWYIAVRLIKESDAGTVYGPYCDPIPVNLSAAPEKPTLIVTPSVIASGGMITASWGYVSNDSTPQSYAEICTATVGSSVTYGDVIAHVETAQYATIDTKDWTTGTTYYLCVRVTSKSGATSDWSDPVSVAIADPLTCSIATSLSTNVTIADSDGVERTVPYVLDELPLTATVTGAGAGGTTTLVIERAQDFHAARPDNSQNDGYEGETIALIVQMGETEISIDKAALIGALDDTAKYRLVATVADGLGQSASASIEFEVHWEHQAGVPGCGVMMDETRALICPTAPSNYTSGDTCDIYRLSADNPELIIRGATFGEIYVDPYPALGEHGGYRAVTVTANGDYTTDDGHLAWADTIGTFLPNDVGIIDFGGESLLIAYNVQLSNRWAKSFKKTEYLGGAVKGDWNPNVTRSGSVNAVIRTADLEQIQKIRRLAEYNGACHVRTQDGSSYAADVQVSGGQSYSKAGKVEEFSLTITRVDSEELDGYEYTGDILFVSTYVEQASGELVAIVSDSMYEYATLHVNEEEGTLEVTLS